jgi:hypothetical protein
MSSKITKSTKGTKTQEIILCFVPFCGRKTRSWSISFRRARLGATLNFLKELAIEKPPDRLM